MNYCLLEFGSTFFNKAKEGRHVRIPYIVHSVWFYISYKNFFIIHTCFRIRSRCVLTILSYEFEIENYYSSFTECKENVTSMIQHNLCTYSYAVANGLYPYLNNILLSIMQPHSYDITLLVHCLISISAHSHHTEARSSTCLYGTLTALSNITLAWKINKNNISLLF
jgi:hypothetical protein